MTLPTKRDEILGVIVSLVIVNMVDTKFFFGRELFFAASKHLAEEAIPIPNNVFQGLAKFVSIRIAGNPALPIPMPTTAMCLT